MKVECVGRGVLGDVEVGGGTCYGHEHSLSHEAVVSEGSHHLQVARHVQIVQSSADVRAE